MMVMRWLMIACAFFMLSGCNGQLGAFGGTPEQSLERGEKDGNVELRFEPVDVWEASTRPRPGAIQDIEGQSLYFIQRESDGIKDIFNQASTRVGIFWDSRVKDTVFLLLVISDKKPAEVRKVEFKTDSTESLLKRAKKFEFKPAKRTFDKKLSSDVYQVKLSAIRSVLESKKAQLVITTNRGDLRIDLSTVKNYSPSTLRNSFKYLLATFVQELDLVQKN